APAQDEIEVEPCQSCRRASSNERHPWHPLQLLQAVQLPRLEARELAQDREADWRIGCHEPRSAAPSRSNSASISLVHFSQLKSLARSMPRAPICSRRAGSSRTSRIAVAISSTFSGSTSRAAPAQTSGGAQVLAVTIGQPQAIASSSGIPNPSYSEGNA